MVDATKDSCSPLIKKAMAGQEVGEADVTEACEMAGRDWYHDHCPRDLCHEIHLHCADPFSPECHDNVDLRDPTQWNHDQYQTMVDATKDSCSPLIKKAMAGQEVGEADVTEACEMAGRDWYHDHCPRDLCHEIHLHCADPFSPECHDNVDLKDPTQWNHDQYQTMVDA